MNKHLIFKVLWLCVLLAPLAARAQLIDGMTGIIQQGQQVGLIWVPQATNPCKYTEYWYLAPQYVYPNSEGAGQTIETLLLPVPGAPTFNSNSGFFRYAKSQLPGGKRLVVSTSELEHCGADGL